MFHAEKLFTSLSMKVAPLNFFSIIAQVPLLDNLFFNNYVVWFSKMHFTKGYI